jgi:prepilin-type N-terminal cleavage/methylation domain-containing protein
MLKKHFQKGFTIVELLIVIVVIGILAALVLNTFSGVQRRARDTERQTDINSIATQLEVYYNDNTGYPILTGQLASDAWADTNLPGIDLNALRPPGAAANAITATATPTAAQYGYQTFAADGTTACNAAPCAKFELHWLREEDNTVQPKDSLN